MQLLKQMIEENKKKDLDQREIKFYKSFVFIEDIICYFLDEKIKFEDIPLFFIEGNFFNFLMYYSILKKKDNITDLAIFSGANYFNWGLRASCEVNNKIMFNRMINYGANNYRGGALVHLSCGNFNESIMDILTKDFYHYDINWLMGNTTNSDAICYLINKGGTNFKFPKHCDDLDLYYMCLNRGMKVNKNFHKNKTKDRIPKAVEKLFFLRPLFNDNMLKNILKYLV